MGKIIQMQGTSQYIVKDKVVFYGLEQEDPNKMTIWLEGGGVTTYSYPDAETAKAALDSFDKIMHEPPKEDKGTADIILKIREEIARLIEETSIGLTEYENGVEHGRMEILNRLSLFLDSLQKWYKDNQWIIKAQKGE